jgi:alcohol dehydrogenase (cytochrome c)
MIPKRDVPLTFCPGMGGVRNWPPAAYHPETRAGYIALRPNCDKARFGSVKPDNVGEFHFYGNPALTGFERIERLPHPASPNHRGVLAAMEVESGKLLWRRGRPSATSSGVLTTAGGIVVVGFADDSLEMEDAITGETIYETRTPGATVSGVPITYAVGGKQYLAFAVTGARNTLKVLSLP